ncbi:MAG: type II secretion system protein M [Nitrosomonadales bacterium]|nr:type II secretion system protein M [Nitrosomonadales bacterium]
MIRAYWEMARSRIDDLSLRERAMIFAAAAFVVVSVMNAVLLDPLLAKQRMLSAQVVQQQEKMKELQAQTAALLQAKNDVERSPLHTRLTQLKAQLKEQEDYLQSRRDRLVAPDEMAALLEQVLNRNGKLQLVGLKTLPVSLLIENAQSGPGQGPPAQRQIFKHGVVITVRGGYLDLMQYLVALEKLPAQMFWGEVSMKVEQYPDSLLTLTLYTLSLDETWLTV